MGVKFKTSIYAEFVKLRCFFEPLDYITVYLFNK